MAASVGINDETAKLLRFVTDKAQMSQAEVVKQGLILYAEQLGLVTTQETKIEVVKRTFELKDQPWASEEERQRH